MVHRSSGSLGRRFVYVALYGITLPYAWLLFVAGPGVVGVLPIVIGLGLSVDMLLRDWAFPRALCSHCGASLEHAPRVAQAHPNVRRVLDGAGADARAMALSSDRRSSRRAA